MGWLIAGGLILCAGALIYSLAVSSSRADQTQIKVPKRGGGGSSDSDNPTPPAAA